MGTDVGCTSCDLTIVVDGIVCAAPAAEEAELELCRAQSVAIAPQASWTELPNERVERLTIASPSLLKTAILFLLRK